MRWPLKNIFITQRWGENPQTYARFGLKGHNGLDLRAPMGTEVFAPHDGTVKERRLDANGYGNYLKIESDKEGSILAHLKDFAVDINKVVKEGDLVGHADNTGFSTATHLHWGYFQIPRNRNDGYSGFINQEPLVGQQMAENQETIIKDLKDKLSWYEKEYPLEQQRLVDEKKKVEKLQGEVGALSLQVEELDNSHSTLVRTLANNLGTTQGENEIIAKVRSILEEHEGTRKQLASLGKEVADFLKQASKAHGSPLTSLEAVLGVLQGGRNGSVGVPVTKPIIQRLLDWISGRK